MSKNDYFKNKASQFISLVSGLAEKKIHSIVDKSSELSSGIEKGIQEAYQTIIDNISDWTDRFSEKDPGEFTNGDLVISPVDVVYPFGIFTVNSNGETNSESHIIKAGEVFEFDEKLIPFLKTPLFEADTKAAIEWARLDELNKIHNILTSESWKFSLSHGELHRMKEYIGNRKLEISKSNQEEKIHHEEK